MAQLNSIASGAVRSKVAASTSYQLFLPVNSARKGYAIYNSSASTLYICLGPVAGSTTDFSFPIAASSLYESRVDFTGVIGGVFSTADTPAYITEFS
jgi:hypothetical protein